MGNVFFEDLVNGSSYQGQKQTHILSNRWNYSEIILGNNLSLEKTMGNEIIVD